jgi:chondroitin AC lyase
MRAHRESRRVNLIITAMACLLALAGSVGVSRPVERPRASPLTPRSAQPAADDLALILQRLKAQYAAANSANYLHGEGEPNHSRAKEWLASQAADGHWPDVGYEDHAPGLRPIVHLDRLAQMASAYSGPASPDYHSVRMLDGVERGLEYWFKKHPVSDRNWWENTIGQPLLLAGTLVPLEDVLPGELLRQGLTYFHGPSEVDPRVFERLRFRYPTATDLVWYAQQLLIRGALARSGEDLAAGSEAMQGVIRITTRDGIQPDFSFRIHARELYNGGYGLDFIVDTSKYAALLAGTRYAYTREKLALLADYLLEGSGHMVRGKLLDYSAIGRTLVRRNSSEGAVQLEAACDELAALVPERASDLMSLKKHIEGTGAPYSFIGNRYFWNSDFMTHQREGYYISVKMVSNRTVGTETINGENLKGCWLPFGATWIVRRGDEYQNIFPALDWGRIPGVTSLHMTTAIAEDVTQPETFVGGVSDGTYGAAAMVFDQSPLLPPIDRELLRLRGLSGSTQEGRKAWFFFDREMVALGTGITFSRDERVGTTLNQTLLYGPVLLNGHALEPGEAKVPPGSAVLHDGVGYAVLGTAAASVKLGPQTGDWQSISAGDSDVPVTESVFSLWIDQGVRPHDGQYVYAVLPGIDAPQLSAWVAHPPVRVIANSSAQLGVIHNEVGVAEIIFYAPGKVALTADATVEVDRRCLVLMVAHDKATRIALSSPGGEAALVHLTLTTHQTTERVTFELPEGNWAGKSQVMEVPARW